MKTQATLLVHGPSQLRSAFRKRLIDALRADAPDVRWTDAPSEEFLSISLDAPQGIPFPQLIEVSILYPDCVASVEWRQENAEGATTIQNGQVKQAARGAALAARRPQYLRMAPDGSLQVAFALDIGRDGLLGFCATADAETYFRFCGTGPKAEMLSIGVSSDRALAWDECWPVGESACLPLVPPRTLEASERRALDSLANAFRAEWLWYDHAPAEDTAVERQRYEEAGREVHAINVKSQQLAAHPSHVVTTLDTDQDWLAAHLQKTWARA